MSQTVTTKSAKHCVQSKWIKGSGFFSDAKLQCLKYTTIYFKSEVNTDSSGVSTNEVTIYSAAEGNDGEQIGWLGPEGQVYIYKKNQEGYDNLDETQKSQRQQLINVIKRLRKNNQILSLAEFKDLSENEQRAILMSIGKSSEADAIIAEAEKAAANAEGKITTANIEKGFQTLSTVEVGGRNARETYGSGYPNNNYYYPADLASNKQDRVKFTMGYSEGTKIDATVESGIKNFQKKINSITGSVTLPIVTGVSDQSSVDWKGAELNPLQAFAAAGALDLFNEAKSGKSLSQIGSSALNIGQEAVQGLADSGMGDAINVWLAQKAVGAQNLLSRTTGAIVNPNLEMLFNAPQLRNFGFTFLLSPRDADEANQVRKIIRFFKQGMSVKTTASNVFLKAPNIFNIKYMTFNTDGTEILHPSINIIKTCALLSMDVQYTPAGTYMTYEDPYRTMTAYQLTMQFGELDPIYDSDYTELDNDNDTVIGY